MPPFQRKTLVLIGAQGVGRRSLKNRFIVLNPTRFGTTVPCKFLCFLCYFIGRKMWWGQIILSVFPNNVFIVSVRTNKQKILRNTAVLKQHYSLSACCLVAVTSPDSAVRKWQLIQALSVVAKSALALYFLLLPEVVFFAQFSVKKREKPAGSSGTSHRGNPFVSLCDPARS